MAYKGYNDGEVSEALIRLAINKYDYDKTAKDTGISTKTLRRWDKLAPKKGLSELLERAIERMLMVIPQTMTGQDWAIALGILMDKWLLIQGLPTARTEEVLKRLNDMGEYDVNAVLDEAEKILSTASSSGVYSGFEQK